MGSSSCAGTDNVGETVGFAALQVSSDGCACLCCRYMWTPDYFTHLARTIGCAVPAGVLE
ncbi:DUF7340 domain-containing protein [Tsukamurella sp. DT100]|uniref:DUF7340 domain-containing protein n=1 Tax=Tsukamurella sp. DT100 TaxID=3393415 RepID=UPI003CFB2CC4